MPEAPELESGAVDLPQTWPVGSTRDLHRDDWVVALRADMVTRPGHEGTPFRRLVLEHPGAAAVLAVDEDDRVLVLQQYRHAVGARLVELPAGLYDVAGEDHLTTAKRELREEAGLRASSWEHLLTTHPSPGVSAERIDVFVARDLTEAPLEGFAPEHEEADMTRAWVPLEELVEAVLESRVSNGPLGLAVLAYARRRDRV